VLAAMQHLALEGARVLDVGCGSGVLSLAACALGASRVEGIDIDPGAVEVARDNAERNGVEDRFVVTLGPLNQVAGPFDVVLANVLGVVLVELADHLVRVTGPAGVLVVSGMLTGATSRVERALRPLEVRSRTTTDGWETVVLARPTS
jgi:ribosomal protein L11 methyltransferase